MRLLSRFAAFSTNRRPALALALVFGLSTAISFILAALVGRANAGPWETLGISAYAVVFFVVISFVMLDRVVFPSLAHLGWRKIPWFVACLVLGGLTIVGFGIRPPRQLPSFHRLEIVNTATRNADAQGSETWLMGWPNGMAIEEDGKQGSEWRATDTGYVATGDRPTALFLSGWTQSEDTIVLRAHQWSGILQYRWDGASYQYIDLYAPSAREISVPVPVESRDIPELPFWLLHFGLAASIGGALGSALAVLVERVARRKPA